MKLKIYDIYGFYTREKSNSIKGYADENGTKYIKTDNHEYYYHFVDDIIVNGKKLSLAEIEELFAK